MATETTALQTEALTKFYGPHRGVEGLDLRVEPGEIFGFLGPNGAGKTTTIRLLLDLIRPTSGHARVLGMDVSSHSIEIRNRVGYLPGELALYENLTGGELLAYFAHLRGTDDVSAGESFARHVDLDLDRRIGTLSKGNKQKVGLAQAFLHRPELLILDEPTSGLDPLVQKDFSGYLRQLAAEGRTVFLSSHVLSEIEEVADRVGIIRAGRLAAVEKLAVLKERAQRTMTLVFGAEVRAEDFRGVAGVREVQIDGRVGHFVVDGSVDAFIKALAQHEVLDLVSSAPDLEEIFLAYYEEPDET